MVQALIITLLIAAFPVASFVMNYNREAWWGTATRLVFDALLVVVIILIAGSAVGMLRRISRRSWLTSDGAALPSALEFSSLLLSYVVYVVSTVAVIFIVLLTFTDLNATFNGLVEFLVANEQEIIVTVAIVPAILFIVKLVDTIWRTSSSAPRSSISRSSSC